MRAHMRIHKANSTTPMTLMTATSSHLMALPSMSRCPLRAEAYTGRSPLVKGFLMRHTLILAAIVVAICLVVGIVADFYIGRIVDGIIGGLLVTFTGGLLVISNRRKGKRR